MEFAMTDIPTATLLSMHRTMTTIQTDVRARAEDLHRFIQEGRIVDALREFYDPDVSMQENQAEPTRGLEANIEREEAWLATVKEWLPVELVTLAIDGEVSFAYTTMGWVTADGEEVHLEQVSKATWRDGKIVEERFFHG